MRPTIRPILRAAALAAGLAFAAATAATPPVAGAVPKAKDVRWRIVKVHLDGWSQYRLDDGDHRFALDGRVKYRTKGKVKGTPFTVKRRAPSVAQVSGGLDWSTTNESSVAGADGTWSCPFQRAQKAGIAGVLNVRGERVDVQWSLAPAHRSCPAGAPLWTFDGLPVKAMTTSFRLSALDARRKQVKITTALEHRWTDSGGTVSEVHWDGHVVLERVTR